MVGVLGRVSVEDQRPTTLLNTKVKWITGILKMSMQDIIMAVVPASKRGFIPKRDFKPHLLSVHSRWRKGPSGVWLSLDFAKAFDITNHALLGDFLLLLGVQKACCEVLLDLLGSELKFLVGPMLADAALQPKCAIKQGDTLSPTLFSLLTTLLVDDWQKKCPQAVPYVYADDTLITIPGGRGQALAKLKRVREILYKYSLVSGYKLNMHKCKLLPQRWSFEEADLNKEGEHQGIKVVRRVEYLGTWLRHVTFDDEFAKPLRAFRNKMAVIVTLPLTLAHKVEVLRVWAFPTLFCVGTVFYPTDGVRRQLDACMRWALGIEPWVCQWHK